MIKKDVEEDVDAKKRPLKTLKMRKKGKKDKRSTG